MLFEVHTTTPRMQLKRTRMLYLKSTESYVFLLLLLSLPYYFIGLKCVDFDRFLEATHCIVQKAVVCQP